MLEKKFNGKKNLRKGRYFEQIVRKDLESRGWIVSRWTNNVDLENGKLIPAKYGKFRRITTGFPDFITYPQFPEKKKVIGVECKTNGMLTYQEKRKIRWLLENRIFNYIFIAKRNGRQIEYKILSL